jgi:hypothetical protein
MDEAASRALSLFEEWDEQYEPYDDGRPYACTRCEGEGAIMVCVDDICRGGGFDGGGCFHPGGYQTCPVCKGSGEIEP